MREYIIVSEPPELYSSWGPINCWDSQHCGVCKSLCYVTVYDYVRNVYHILGRNLLRIETPESNSKSKMEDL